jgi:hypothetical protein
MEVAPIPIMVRAGQRHTKRQLEEGMLGFGKPVKTKMRIVPMLTEEGVAFKVEHSGRSRQRITERNKALMMLLLKTTELE